MDDEKVAAVGRSSGGHLAMLLAYSRPSNFTLGVYNLYGPGDFGEWFDKGWVGGGTAGMEFECHKEGDHWR